MASNPAQISAKTSKNAAANSGKTQKCTAHWIGIEARYDDRWNTALCNVRTRAKVDGALVLDGSKTKSLSTLGMIDCDEGADPTHAQLGRIDPEYCANAGNADG